MVLVSHDVTGSVDTTMGTQARGGNPLLRAKLGLVAPPTLGDASVKLKLKQKSYSVVLSLTGLIIVIKHETGEIAWDTCFVSKKWGQSPRDYPSL